MNRRISLTAEPIWFFFTVNLLTGPGKVFNNFSNKKEPPPKKIYKIKLKTGESTSPPPLHFQQHLLWANLLELYKLYKVRRCLSFCVKRRISLTAGPIFFCFIVKFLIGPWKIFTFLLRNCPRKKTLPQPNFFKNKNDRWSIFPSKKICKLLK